jgi:hypothetical protein
MTSQVGNTWSAVVLLSKKFLLRGGGSDAQRCVDLDESPYAFFPLQDASHPDGQLFPRSLPEKPPGLVCVEPRDAIAFLNVEVIYPQAEVFCALRVMTVVRRRHFSSLDVFAFVGPDLPEMRNESDQLDESIRISRGESVKVVRDGFGGVHTQCPPSLRLSSTIEREVPAEEVAPHIKFPSFPLIGK